MAIEIERKNFNNFDILYYTLEKNVLSPNKNLIEFVDKQMYIAWSNGFWINHMYTHNKI